jgi:NAD(P)-dependent dehydrogenase (short-subunit alcohol dehydrogenase family)
LDVLINNAGVIITRPCDTLTSLREHFETNAFGPALVTEAFEPLLKKSKEPRIIYVSSDQGSVTTRLNPTYKWYQMRGDHYRMSKAAVNMLAACHRVNFAEWGCKVAAFNPDFCVTNLSGEERKAFGRENGARDPREPALALVAIVGRERDEEFGENGMMDVDGDVKPW